MDGSLEQHLEDPRLAEMTRYSRTEIYPRMVTLVDAPYRDILDLVNHGLALVDDELDTCAAPLERLASYRDLFLQGYAGDYFACASPVASAVLDLGYMLHYLASGSFWQVTSRAIARHTAGEVLSFWDAEAANFSRQGKLLDQKSLDVLTREIGAPVASQFLFILDAPRDPFAFRQLTRAYGFAVKLADNLCDFREDAAHGFFNVAREDISAVQGLTVDGDRVCAVDVEQLSFSKPYLERQRQRIQNAFTSADTLLLFTRVQRPCWDRKLHERLDLFGQFCRSWLSQAEDFVQKELARADL